MESSRCRLAELLTTEILIEILIRLPLECLLVCRRVCKSWNHLILQPFFADLHRTFSPLTIMLVHESKQPRLVPNPPYNDDYRTTFGLITGGGSSSYNLKFTDKVIQHIPEIYLVGSCNGLICLSSWDEEYYEEHYPGRTDDDDPIRLVLCNPILGSHFILPDPPLVREFGPSTQIGFGYIPSNRQYKAVKFVYVKSQSRFFFHVCTIQSGGGGGNNKRKLPPSASAWRTVYNENGGGYQLPLLSNYYSYPTFFRGSIIWIAESQDWAECQWLIYFDIEKEEMQTFPLPLDIGRDHDWRHGCNFDDIFKIGVYYDDGGHDGLYICEELESRANIWVMEDHNKLESLKLKWVIQQTSRIRLPVTLLRVLKDGKLLIGVQNLLIGVQNSTLGYYEPNTGVFETMKNLQFAHRSYIALDTPNLLGCML